jgi:type VI secretion system secreted protein Hcp
VTAYMKFGNLKGDATLAAVKDWINISHFEWSVTWAVTTRASASGTRDAKAPTVNEISIKKETDNSSRYLLDAITRNNYSNPKGETCTIRFLSTGQGDDIDEMIYQEFILYESLITSITYNSEGDRAVETVKLNFTGVEMKVWPRGLGNMSRDNRTVPVAVIFERYNKTPGK